MQIKTKDKLDNIGYVSKQFPYTKLMSWEFYKHRHSFWEIIACIKGSAEQYIDETKYIFNSGDIIFMKPGCIHDYKILDAGNYAHYDFYSSAEEMKRACEHISPGLYERIAADPRPIRFSVDSVCMNYLESKLNKLNSLQKNEQFEKHAEAMYNTILHTLCGQMLEHVISQRADIPNWLLDLLTTMSKPDMLCKKVSDIVIASNFSHGHLCKLFKQYTNKTLSDYFMQLKIDYANVLLKNKDLSILDISGLLGYDSLSHFIQIFKKLNGITPKQYRKVLYEQ